MTNPSTLESNSSYSAYSLGKARCQERLTFFSSLDNFHCGLRQEASQVERMRNCERDNKLTNLDNNCFEYVTRLASFSRKVRNVALRFFAVTE